MSTGDWPERGRDLDPDRFVPLEIRDDRVCGSCGRVTQLVDNGCTGGFALSCPLCGFVHERPVRRCDGLDVLVDSDPTPFGWWVWWMDCGTCGRGRERRSWAAANADAERHREPTRRAA